MPERKKAVSVGPEEKVASAPPAAPGLQPRAAPTTVVPGAHCAQLELDGDVRYEYEEPAHCARTSRRGNESSRSRRHGGPIVSDTEESRIMKKSPL
jgi:hypothetical protein